MKQIATGRVGPVVAKFGENAQSAAVCCNACRTCVTANVVDIAGLTLSAAAGGVWRFARRKSA